MAECTYYNNNNLSNNKVHTPQRLVSSEMSLNSRKISTSNSNNNFNSMGSTKINFFKDIDHSNFDQSTKFNSNIN